ncbi:MAG: response regulator [Myxococcota bacterium]
MSQRLLIVDDNEMLAENICEFLRDEGYDVRVATNPEEALNLPCFDGYVLDVRMPGLDGWSLRQRLVERCDCARFVLMTAFQDPSHRPAGETLNPLPKPIPFDRLLDQLQS